MSTDYRPQPWDGEATIDDPQKMVVMSEAWWVYVRGAFERLTQVEAWEDFGLSDMATGQALDALARLLGTEDIPSGENKTMIEFPVLALDYHDDADVIWTEVANAITGGVARVTDMANDEKLFENVVHLTPGNWHFVIIARTSPANGKYRAIINESDEMTGDCVDFYAASAVNNVIQKWSTTIVSEGDYTFSLLCCGKNASSTDYDLRLSQAFWVKHPA